MMSSGSEDRLAWIVGLGSSILSAVIVLVSYPDSGASDRLTFAGIMLAWPLGWALVGRIFRRRFELPTHVAGVGLAALACSLFGVIHSNLVYEFDLSTARSTAQALTSVAVAIATVWSARHALPSARAGDLSVLALGAISATPALVAHTLGWSQQEEQSPAYFEVGFSVFEPDPALELGDALETLLSASGTLSPDEPTRRVSPLAWGPRVKVTGGLVKPNCLDQNCESEGGRTVAIPDFDIDRTEVTHGAFALCVAASACRAPAWLGACEVDSVLNWNLPVTCVDGVDASGFCEWAGGRLPTIFEWDLLASQMGGRVQARRTACALGTFKGCNSKPTEVGTHRGDVTQSGIRDLSGNVSEWASDAFLNDDGTTVLNPRSMRATRGGSFQTETSDVRAEIEVGRVFDSWDRAPFVGFRCVYSPAK